MLWRPAPEYDADAEEDAPRPRNPRAARPRRARAVAAAAAAVAAVPDPDTSGSVEALLAAARIGVWPPLSATRNTPDHELDLDLADHKKHTHATCEPDPRALALNDAAAQAAADEHGNGVGPRRHVFVHPQPLARYRPSAVATNPCWTELLCRTPARGIPIRDVWLPPPPPPTATTTAAALGPAAALPRVQGACHYERTPGPVLLRAKLQRRLARAAGISAKRARKIVLRNSERDERAERRRAAAARLRYRLERMDAQRQMDDATTESVAHAPVYDALHAARTGLTDSSGDDDADGDSDGPTGRQRNREPHETGGVDYRVRAHPNADADSGYDTDEQDVTVGWWCSEPLERDLTPNNDWRHDGADAKADSDAGTSPKANADRGAAAPEEAKPKRPKWPPAGRVDHRLLSVLARDVARDNAASRTALHVSGEREGDGPMALGFADTALGAVMRYRLHGVRPPIAPDRVVTGRVRNGYGEYSHRWDSLLPSRHVLYPRPGAVVAFDVDAYHGQSMWPQLYVWPQLYANAVPYARRTAAGMCGLRCWYWYATENGWSDPRHTGVNNTRNEQLCERAWRRAVRRDDRAQYAYLRATGRVELWDSLWGEVPRLFEAERAFDPRTWLLPELASYVAPHPDRDDGRDDPDELPEHAAREVPYAAAGSTPLPAHYAFDAADCDRFRAFHELYAKLDSAHECWDWDAHWAVYSQFVLRPPTASFIAPDGSGSTWADGGGLALVLGVRDLQQLVLQYVGRAYAHCSPLCTQPDPCEGCDLAKRQADPALSYWPAPRGRDYAALHGFYWTPMADGGRVWQPIQPDTHTHAPPPAAQFVPPRPATPPPNPTVAQAFSEYEEWLNEPDAEEVPPNDPAFNECKHILRKFPNVPYPTALMTFPDPLGVVGGGDEKAPVAAPAPAAAPDAMTQADADAVAAALQDWD